MARRLHCWRVTPCTASSEGDMAHAILGLHVGQAAALRTAPPPWAILAVKICVVGILLLPLSTPPVLFAASSLLGPKEGETLRMVGSMVAIGLWLAMLACAQFLTAHFPPVPRK
jgi:hypothetical protein